MDGLEAVVVEETQLVRAGHLSKASGLGLKKAELSGAYFKTVERLKAHGSVSRAWRRRTRQRAGTSFCRACSKPT